MTDAEVFSAGVGADPAAAKHDQITGSITLTILLRWACMATLGIGLNVFAAEHENGNDAVSQNTLRVARRGDAIFIRSSFSQSRDLIVCVAKGINRQINFSSAFLVEPSAIMTNRLPDGAELFHPNGDDACPWQVNGDHIGGNHGHNRILELTCAAHGRTAADLGSEWVDAASNKFYLIKIMDPDKLWFLGENLGTGPIWNFKVGCAGQAFTSKGRGVTLNFTTNKLTQLRPACRITKQEYLLNGKTPLPDGQVASGAYFDIIEEYDIVNPGAVLADVIAHPGVERNFTAGHLAAFMHNRIIYRFYPNGANVIDYSAKALQDFNLGYMGFIQSAPLRRKDYQTSYYIPKTTSFTLKEKEFNFKAIQDYVIPQPVPLTFSAADKNIADPTNLPDRFIQFLGRKTDGATAREIGYAFGYSLIQGITRPELRAAHTRTAIILAASSKSYPHAIDKKMGPLIRANTEFHCIAYRHYFDAAAYKNATCVYWHPEGDDIVLYADYHKSVENDVIHLPAEFTGKNITVIEKTPSVTLRSDTVIPVNGLILSVRDGYGYVVLKIR